MAVKTRPDCILVTGGSGFIGSHVTRRLVKASPDRLVVNLDALTYCGNPANLADVAELPNYVFRRGSICDESVVDQLFQEYRFSQVVHLAAESHVDRSISGPMDFIRTNVLGTGVLLQACKNHWGGDFSGKVFLHVSTDEVFGSLTEQDPAFSLQSPYAPRSPYAASKAASDHMVRAFWSTYGLPVCISNCSNNFGPNQFPEKLIPLCIKRILMNERIPVYGSGQNIRDWLYVEDHASALELILATGRPGETYLIGGDCEVRNLQLVEKLCDCVDEQMGAVESSRRLISFVQDRLGHDHRYAIDSRKTRSELGWSPRTSFEVGLRETVRWYLDNQLWLGIPSPQALNS